MVSQEKPVKSAEQALRLGDYRFFRCFVLFRGMCVLGHGRQEMGGYAGPTRHGMFHHWVKMKTARRPTGINHS